ncbi:MAG: FAD-dependent oxidoreductase, partial [Desulfovermiculus sp.]
MSQDVLNVLIVGGVACGPKAAARIKRLKPETQVTLIEKSGHVSFGACGIPYFIEGHCEGVDALYETPVGVKRTPEFFEKCKGFQVKTGTEALHIDRKAKKVRIKEGQTGREEDMAYDKLVLATGSSPIQPP